MTTTVPVYIFDIDGTCADHSHRLPLIANKPAGKAARDAMWAAFHDACHLDPPIVPMCHLAHALLTSFTPARVLFVTGRMEFQRETTRTWLAKHVQWDCAEAYLDLAALERGEGYGAWLIMRPEGDQREDTIIKGEILDRIIAAGITPVMAFENRPRICELWTKRGLIVAKIGNFEEVNQSAATEAWACREPATIDRGQ